MNIEFTHHFFYIPLWKKRVYIKKCPVCGRLGLVTVYKPQQYWLDGVPKMPIRKYLKGFRVCSKCGCIYGHNALSHDPSFSWHVQQREYQDALRAKMDKTEKLLSLLWLMGLEGYDVDLLRAHYYEQTRQEDRIQPALLQVASFAMPFRNPDYHLLTPQNTPQLPLTHEFFLYGDRAMVDILRRAHQFDDALTRIEQMRNDEHLCKNHNLMMYLQCEEGLIRTNDITLH